MLGDLPSVPECSIGVGNKLVDGTNPLRRVKWRRGLMPDQVELRAVEGDASHGNDVCDSPRYLERPVCEENERVVDTNSLC